MKLARRNLRPWCTCNTLSRMSRTHKRESSIKHFVTPISFIDTSFLTPAIVSCEMAKHCQVEPGTFLVTHKAKTRKWPNWFYPRFFRILVSIGRMARHRKLSIFPPRYSTGKGTETSTNRQAAKIESTKYKSNNSEIAGEGNSPGREVRGLRALSQKTWAPITAPA